MLRLDQLVIVKQPQRGRALKQVHRGAVRSRRCPQCRRRWYSSITAETIDSVVNRSVPGKHFSARRYAFKEAHEKACAQGGARGGVYVVGCKTKHPCTSCTRTEEGVSAPQLYPTYPNKPSSRMVTRTCQLNSKHAIASGVRLQLLCQ